MQKTDREEGRYFQVEFQIPSLLSRGLGIKSKIELIDIALIKDEGFAQTDLVVRNLDVL